MNTKAERQEETKKDVEKDDNLKLTLSKKSKDELLTIIYDLMDTFPDIDNRVRYKYASSDNEITDSKKLIREYVNKAKRSGFIDWRSASYSVQGAVLTLEKARDALRSHEVDRAVKLCMAVLSIVVDMLQYCDDSDGSVGDVIRKSVSMIKEACAIGKTTLTEKDQLKLFKEVLKEANHKRYDGWDDWRFELLEACVAFASQPKIRIILEEQLEALLEDDSSSWNAKFTNQQIRLIQLKMIELYDSQEKKKQFIQTYIQYSEIREIAIQDHLEKKQFEEVLRLCEQGILYDKEYRGLVHKWGKYKYQAYEGLGDWGNQRKLAKEFVLGNDGEFYPLLKSLYTSEEWNNVLLEIVETFENKSYQPDIYVKILIEENLDTHLLKYCQNNPPKIVHLYEHLIAIYPDEVNEVFKDYIQYMAKEANERRKYKEVCKIIRTYKEACGTNKAEEIIEDLKKQHARRPAFLEELGKVK
jgi:hypothetical protein